MFSECRARIRLLKREGLQFAFLMMLRSNVARRLLSKLLEHTHTPMDWLSLSRIFCLMQLVQCEWTDIMIHIFLSYWRLAMMTTRMFGRSALTMIW
jgi:hypothetical protein